MLYTIDQLDNVINKISKEQICTLFTYLNRTNDLCNIFKNCGLDNLVDPLLDQVDRKNTFGKILILGSADLADTHIKGIFSSLGIDKSRVELCTEYKQISKYNISKLRYNDNYTAVFVGPMPHSGKGMGIENSIISALEKGSGYPPVFRLSSNNSLKITKSNLKSLISENIQNGIFSVDNCVENNQNCTNARLN